jgi:DNA-binding PadR family transcriptional regulator
LFYEIRSCGDIFIYYSDSSNPKNSARCGALDHFFLPDERDWRSTLNRALGTEYEEPVEAAAPILHPPGRTAAAGVPKQKRRALGFRELQVLCLLWVRPMSVYEIRRELSAIFGSSSSFGTLYPLLRSMEAARLVSGVWGLNSENRPKRAYSLTESGRRAAFEGVQRQARLSSRLQSMISIGSAPGAIVSRENKDAERGAGDLTAVSRGVYLW